MKKILSTILALAACTTLPAQDFKITHGPWLCDLTSDGVTVVWATSKPALSWVEVAEDDGRSFYAAEHERRYETVAGRKQAHKTLHSIRLKGLRPDTKYRYRIFSQEVREWKYNDKVYYGDIAASNVYSRQPFAFSTLPTSGCDLSFVVLNDIHGRADHMAGLCRPIDFAQIDFVAFNGDMSNSTESPEQLYRDFIDASVGAFASETPILYNRGNHETRGIYADHLPEYFPKVGGNYYNSTWPDRWRCSCSTAVRTNLIRISNTAGWGLTTHTARRRLPGCAKRSPRRSSAMPRPASCCCTSRSGTEPGTATFTSKSCFCRS